MKNKWLVIFLALTVCLYSAVMPGYFAAAESHKKVIVGDLYRFDTDGGYDYTVAEKHEETVAGDNTYGSLTLNGSIVTDGVKDGIPSYGVDGGTIILSNNVIKDCSTKEHGGAFSVEEADVKWIMVNNLIQGNVSRNGGGYCGVAMIYNKTHFFAMNNTIVDNYNFDEGGTPPDGRDEWAIIHTRGGGLGQEFTMINNLIVGNISWCSTDNLPYGQYFNLSVNCAADRWHCYRQCPEQYGGWWHRE